MTKDDHIQYWKTTAESDWQAVQNLFEKGSYLQAMFFSHLVLEKLLKAHWVKDNRENVPPKTHNLTILHDQTDLELTETDQEFIVEMNTFQLAGRYPDYHFKISKLCTPTYTKEKLEAIEKLKLYILSMLP
jgi:HEPN domain-containing protein